MAKITTDENDRLLRTSSARSIIPRLAGAVAFSLPLAIVCDRLEFVETPSIPFRFAFEAFGKPIKGDYVRVPVQNAHINEGRPSTLTKRIACLAGDVLTYDGRSHFCNGILIDTASQVTLVDGTNVPAFIWNGVIPQGSFYLLGTHAQSFDSRYLGFFSSYSAVKVWGLF